MIRSELVTRIAEQNPHFYEKDCEGVVLSSFRDPDAQAHALDELSKAVVRLGHPSPSLLLLMEAIDREWERLTGVSV